MHAMFSALGVLHVDHYAVTTKDLTATLNDFLSIPNAKLLRGPGENPAQQVYYAFVELNGMGVVEILAPLNESSPILSHLTSGGGAYHVCYAVKDLDEAVNVAEKEFGAKLILEPRKDGAFDGRRVAFLVHPNHGLFELLEAYPAKRIMVLPQDSKVKKSESNKYKLMEIYRTVIGQIEIDFEKVNMANSLEWDSFKHLMYIMEVEKQFEISIPAADMSSLDSLSKIENYLRNK